MELPIVAVFVLAPFLILAVEVNSAMYADATESYSGPKLPDTHVDKLDDAFLKFLHQKLNQHSEALEKIKQVIEANENRSKKILETLSYVDNGTLENAETYESRRARDEEENTDDNVVKKEKNKMSIRADLSKACRLCELEKSEAKTSTTTKKPKKTTRKPYTYAEVDIRNYVEK